MDGGPGVARDCDGSGSGRRRSVVARGTKEKRNELDNFIENINYNEIVGH